MRDLKFKEMKSRLYTAHEHINDHMVMVLQSTRRWEVDLNLRTRTYIEWKISGMPCVHAVVAIQERRLSIPIYFHFEKYAATYGGNVRMIPDRTKWNKNNPIMVTPPPFKRQPGRPKTSRGRGPDEPDARSRAPRNKCSKCRQYGHNHRSCDGPIGGSQGRNGAGTSTNVLRGGGAKGCRTRARVIGWKRCT